MAVSADIQKMYREILLHPGDRHLHRFLWRPKQVGPIGTYAMNRVTFGVTSSPFLAMRTLFKIVEDFGESAPLASRHVNDSMYVDDLLAGGDTVAEAVELFNQMRKLLKLGNFNIVKWRSSSSTVLDQIPDDICEHEVTKQDLVDRTDAKHPKALGLIWESSEDVMATQVEMVPRFETTKRGVISDVSRVFDVLGWLAPAIVPMKLVFQKLWLEKIGWDEQVPHPYKAQHERWREELPLLSQVKMKRCYFAPEKTVSVTLHGFCDASMLAYAAVIFIRATYSDRAPTCELVVAKTKVAPLKEKELSILRLELCGAALLARLMESTRQALGVLVKCCHAWSDSTTVLAWLDGSPKRYKTYVGNRLASINKLLPPECWKHVPTLENPADCASRGVSPGELIKLKLWWEGPPWLSVDPVQVPPQPGQKELDELASLEERKEVLVGVVTTPPALWLEGKYSNYQKLVRINCLGY